MRKGEIETRMTEIKGLLDGEAEVDVDAMETEMTELRNKLDTINKRKELADSIAKGAAPVKVIEHQEEEKRMEYSDVISTPEYRSAFLKSLMGKPLTEAEKREYVMTPPGNVGSGAAAVPTQTANMIFDQMTKIAPMLREIQLLRVAGNLRFAVQGVRNAAAAHVENNPIVPAADTLVTVTLTGYEFVKVIRISQTIQTMGIDMFEGWIAKIIGEDLAVVLDNEIINGGTVSGSISAAQIWADGVNQITYVPGNGLAYDDITDLIALLPSAFDANAKFIMNKATFYRQVLGMVDANGNPIAVPDIASPGRYNILGYPVLIDDNVAANEAYLGDFKQVVGNLAADIQVARSTESGFLNNSIDFRGTCIFDCDVAQGTAIVKLNV